MMKRALPLEKKQERRQFYGMTARLTLPIVLQNFMDTAVSAADVVMLSFVSQTALAASSLASQVQFVLSMIFYGLSGGTAVLTAQYWGKGDTGAIEKVMESPSARRSSSRWSLRWRRGSRRAR